MYIYLPSNIQDLFKRQKIAYSMRGSRDLECSAMRSMSLCVKGCASMEFSK